MFSLFTSHSFAEIKYETYKKLPCSFNGAKVGTSTILSFKKSPRCKNWKGYPLKRGTSVMVKRGTPVFAITNMKLDYAIHRSAKQRCKKLNKVHKKGVCDRPFDDIELMFFDVLVRKYILEEQEHMLADHIRKSDKDGMQDFTTSLKSLIDQGLIDRQAALDVAPNREALQMALKGIS